MLGADRLAYWARQYGFGAPTGIDLPGEVSGIVPNNKWKMNAFGQPMFEGETYQAGIGQGYDVVTPIQLIDAYAALANGGKVYRPQVVREVVGPDGKVVTGVQAGPHPQAPGVAGDAARHAHRRAPHRHAAPHLQPRRHAREGGRQVGHGRVRDSATARAASRSTRGSSGWVPKNPYKADFTGTDSQLVFLAFAYDSRTVGNAATEIAKAFLQFHFHIKHDFLNRDLLDPRQPLPEQLGSPDARDAGRAKPLHRCDREVRRGGLALLRPAAHDLRGAPRRVRPRDGLHEQRRGRPVDHGQRHGVLTGADVVRPRDRRVHRRDGVRLPLAQDAGLADLRHQPRAARASPSPSATASAARRAGSRSARSRSSSPSSPRS